MAETVPQRVTGTLGPSAASGTSGTPSGGTASPASSLKLDLVAVPLLPDTNVILGQSHFIKTVEDLFEAVNSVGGGIKFGLAFSEASGESRKT